MPNSTAVKSNHTHSFDDSENRNSFYKNLQLREKQWWGARQHLITLKERQMFWFGENSFIMWLLWQLVSYVVVAIVLMLLSNLTNSELPLWQYISIFSVQTVIFLLLFAFKGRLANNLQSKIDAEDSAREQALNEMLILAADSIFPDIHASSPISLQHIHERYESRLRIASLQCLLQREVDAGRLLLAPQKSEMRILPPELADDELRIHASTIIYKSVV